MYKYKNNIDKIANSFSLKGIFIISILLEKWFMC